MTFLEGLLRRLIGRHQAAALLGDLREEAARGPTDSRLWLARELLGAVFASAWISAGRKQARMRVLLKLAIRDAVRSIRRFPGSTALAFGVVTLSIAAATVTFSVVDTVVLRRLPFADDHRLIAIYGSTPENPHSRFVSPPDYYAWRDGTQSFETLAAWVPRAGAVQLGADAEDVGIAFTTANLFDVLRVQPAIGRAYDEQHEARGRDDVALISHDLWRQRFASDPDVVGRTLRMDDTPVTVIGVMPHGFKFPIDQAEPVEIWRPLAIPLEERAITPQIGRSSYIKVIGRLREEATIEQARAEVEAISSRMASGAPVLYERWQVRVAYFHDSLTEPVRGWMLLALAAVALVVLLACANVANLLLARFVTRGRDLAIRASLGATRGQLLVLLVVEGLLLSCAAATAGIALAWFSVNTVRNLLPEGIARASEIALDLRVLGAASAAAVTTGLLFGVFPAWQASRANLVDSLKQGGTAATPGSQRWRSALMLAQTALVTALLVVTTLFVGSFVRVLRSDLGFQRSNLLSVQITPAFPGLEGRAWQDRADALLREAMEALRAAPGVTRVAAIGGGPVPLTTGRAGAVLESRDGPLTVEIRSVSPGYFETASIRLLRGRDFRDSDRRDTTRVVVVDELAARHIFGTDDPIGRLVRFPGGMRATVVGVVANVKLRGPEGHSGPQLYHPLAQRRVGAEIVIRTAVPPARVMPAIREVIANHLPAGSPAPSITVVDDEFRRLTAARRFNATVVSAFGLLALIIGIAGIYGVTASLVAQQTREIGIRMALGANGRRVVREIATSTGRMLLVGSAIGLAAAWAASGLFTSLVFGIEPSDALPYVLPFSVLSVAGLLSALVPAVRASRIDPLLVLRRE